MKIAAVCVTFNRPALLGRMIRCFELQTHDDRELIILDDAGQYGDRQGDRWRIVSVKVRYPSLGAKRNAVLSLVSPDSDCVAVWDDDDLYMPWQLSASVAALVYAEWAQPRRVLEEIRLRRFTQHETFNRSTPDVYGYHGGWAFRRGIIEAAGGYPPISNGEDADLAERLTATLGPSVDTISDQYPTPGYVYNFRPAGYHVSAIAGDTVYDQLGQVAVEPAGPLNISWPADYLSWPIDPGVRARRW